MAVTLIFTIEAHTSLLQIPAILLSTLCYALWFSFARIGSSHLSPTFWPLIWLACSGFIVFNPLPVFNKTARWWFLKNMGRQLTSGLHRVEFADFWMGDQFCSLIYPISNLYLLACAYSGGLDQTWNKCLSPGPWGVPFLLASLPLLARLIQSVRRWVDSRLTTHLINGGKYAAGIVYYVAYYNWRHHGGGRGGDFVAWCVFGTIYALYASAWDFLMDWSVFRPHAQYPLLRDNVLYSNNIPLYYLAIATNLLIRFIWVLYIPQRGPPFPLRTFIAAMLEMLRRWQWNFFRLENEHLGNVDQYRVTREVPLPYSFDDAVNDSEGDDDSDQKSISSWRNRRRAAKAEASKDVYKAGADTDPLS
ncbi:EXS family-domain-containing protein [Cytidiella melzeri]|nr:EXS family-domain-containing protein [Cytidiella melzeri]